MVIVGIAFIAGGIVLVFNVGRSADGLAALARPWPSWLRGWAGDNPNNYRAVGVAWILIGVVLTGKNLGFW